MSAYKMVTLDLSVAHNIDTRGEVIAKRTEVEQLTVMVLPPGADLQLYLGERPDAIPVRAEGMEIQWDQCDGENDGIYYTNVAQAGVTVVLYIGFGAAITARN